MLGDLISSVATPIARALHMDCIDPETNDLRPESPCAKAKNQLNQGVPVWDVFYERFFGQPEKKEEKNMQIFIVQLAVEAEDVRDAVAKIPSELPIRSITPGPTAPPQNQQRPPIPQPTRP
jgi:hypothetical protein